VFGFVDHTAQLHAILIQRSGALVVIICRKKYKRNSFWGLQSCSGFVLENKC